MPEFDNIDSVLQYILQEVTNCLQNEVADTVIRIAEQKVNTEVYRKYTPKINGYKRTYKLRSSFTRNKTKNGIEIGNNRNENGRDIAAILEEGGDAWKPFVDRWGYGFTKPRPFMQETFRVLKDGVIIKDILREKLASKGIDIL